MDGLATQAGMAFQGGSAFDPLSLSPLGWWDGSDTSTMYDAVSGGSLVADDGTIARWEDKSGNGNHMEQPTAATRPFRRDGELNGNSVIEMEAADLMTCSRLYTDDDFSIFAVIRGTVQSNKGIVTQHPGNASTGRTSFLTTNDTSPTDAVRLFFNNGTSRQVRGTSTAFDGSSYYTLYSESDGAGNSHVRVNAGSAEGTLTGQTWTPYNSSFSLGALSNGVDGFAGFFAEVLAFPHLADSDRADVVNYLKNKWGHY